MSYSTELFENINWDSAWNILRDIVIPNSGTLIFSTILFVLLGFVVALISCIVLWRKGVMKRRSKYYNWAVKLYIPLLFIGITYIFGQWGFVKGIYKILDSEKAVIVQQVYKESISQLFASEEAKNNFVESVQEIAIEARSSSDNYAVFLENYFKSYSSDNAFIDEKKNDLAKYIISRYKDDLYTLAVYSLINYASERVDVSGSISYEEFSVIMDFLLDAGYEDIEKVIVVKLESWLGSVITSQYDGIVRSLWILLLFVFAFPLLEYLFYKKWILPRRIME